MASLTNAFLRRIRSRLRGEAGFTLIELMVAVGIMLVALLAQADNQSRVYGAANPVLTISYSGFVGSDTVTNLAVPPIATAIP